MWPLATLAASLRTDTSPPKQGGFFIGTPHSPSALALRSRPPHSPLGTALRTRPPPSPSALALRARHANPTIPPFWHAPPHSPLGAALRSRPPHSPLGTSLRTCPSAPHSALALRTRHLRRGLPRPRTPAAFGFRFGAPSPSSRLPAAE